MSEKNKELDGMICDNCGKKMICIKSKKNSWEVYMCKCGQMVGNIYNLQFINDEFIDKIKNKIKNFKEVRKIK